MLQYCEKILKDNKDLVNLLADTLMEHETLTKEQIDSLVKTGKLNNTEDTDLTDLKNKAKEAGIKGYTKMNKEELEEALNNSQEDNM